MKIPGVLAVICAFLSLGTIRLRAMKEEISCTKALIAGLFVLKSELAARLCSMQELLHKASQASSGEAAAFFQEAADRLEDPSEAAFSDLWSALCRSMLPSLSETLRTELETLGRSLGRFDLDDQLAACDRMLSAADRKLLEITRRYPEQRRLTMTLCGCAASFLCLLIL